MRPRVLALAALALLPGAAPAAVAADEVAAPVIRISVELIQVDAVVVDGDGIPVTDLGPEDFEIREKGRLRAITHLAYVRAGESWTWRTSPGGATPVPAAPAPPRTLVVVFDDLGVSPEGATWARNALLQVAQRLLPTDRVAVVTTSQWRGALELTSDPGAVSASIRALGYNPWARTAPAPRRQGAHGELRRDGDDLDRNWDSGMRSLRALDGVVEALSEIDGRKALLLVSEGFADITTFERYLDVRPWGPDLGYGDSHDGEEALRQLGDHATRASVVVHALDPRGLMVRPIGGGVAGSSSSGVRLATALADAGRAQEASAASLEHLPRETGGLAIIGSNDLEGGVERVLDSLSGYYLIGFAPGPETFDEARDFRRIDVKVRRRGLRVHTRRGFYGFTREAPPPTP